jgi:hypothetical protein
MPLPSSFFLSTLTTFILFDPLTILIMALNRINAGYVAITTNEDVRYIVDVQ